MKSLSEFGRPNQNRFLLIVERFPSLPHIGPQLLGLLLNLLTHCVVGMFAASQRLHTA